MNIKEVEAFFFKAMMNGYADEGRQTISITEMPGYKSIPFRAGDFYLLDLWCSNATTSSSAGMATIWYKQVPVWVMTYEGMYNKEEIPFLKRCLQANYEKEVFIGGRGPQTYLDVPSNRLYTNRAFRRTFALFEGREEILDLESNKVIGFHNYRGRFINSE